MSAYCDEFYKKIAEQTEKLRAINARGFARQMELPEGTKAEDIEDILVGKHGLPRSLARTILNNSPGFDPDAEKIADASNKMANTALENAKSIAEQMKTPEGRQALGSSMRQMARDVISWSFNHIPKGANQPFWGALREFASGKNALKVGTKANGEDVYAGEIYGKILAGEVKDLWKKTSKADMNHEQFRQALRMIAQTRGSDARKSIEATKAKVEANVKDGKFLETKNTLPAYDLALKIVDKPEIKKFIQDKYDDLDVFQKGLIEHRVLRAGVDDEGNPVPAGRKNYYPNTVFLKQYQDPFESMMEGDKISRSNFKKQKVYDNGLQAIENGVMPATLDFVDELSAYARNSGNALRHAHLAEVLRSNAVMPMENGKKFIISEGSDDFKPAVVTNEGQEKGWEVPKTADGSTYKDLGNIDNAGQYRGIYAHPEFYSWLEANLRVPKVKGVFKTFLRATQMVKGITFFTPGLYHAGSLGRKAIYAGAGAKIQGFWNPFSMQGEGLAAIANKHPSIFKWFGGGFMLHQHDFMRQTFGNREYNMKTGDLTYTSKFNDFIDKYTNWGHDWLFEKWQLGVKMGFALRLERTEAFQNMVRDHGEDYAYAHYSEMLNNTFGGQNLEMMGRSKVMQSVLQAFFLAPDWQEAKFRRLFGTVVSADPEIRKSYQGAMAMEVACMVMGHLAFQQVMGAVTGHQRTMAQTEDDILSGDLGLVHIGKTPDGKKDIVVRLFASEMEETRPFLHIAKGYFDALTGKGPETIAERVYKPLLGNIGKEVRNRAAPLTKFALDLGNKAANKPKGPSPFDLPFLPISMQQAIFAARGGYGQTEEQREKMAIATLLASYAGVPVETKSPTKEPKKEKRPLKLF